MDIKPLDDYITYKVDSTVSNAVDKAVDKAVDDKFSELMTLVGNLNPTTNGKESSATENNTQPEIAHE